MYRWQTGVNLSELSPRHLQTVPALLRLRWFKTILDQINRLHGLACIHGDLKPKNLIVNQENHKIILIDFEHCRKFLKRGLNISHATPSYSRFGLVDFHMDMHALSCIFAILFPELFRESSISENNIERFVYDFIPQQPSVWQSALFELFHAMQFGGTSETALQFCQAIMDDYHVLDQDLLANHKSQIIARKEYTVEDVLRLRTF